MVLSEWEGQREAGHPSEEADVGTRPIEVEAYGAVVGEDHSDAAYAFLVGREGLSHDDDEEGGHCRSHRRGHGENGREGTKEASF